MWHHQFADVLHALARVKPRAVGVDVVLPERSFDAIIPGLDMAMMRGLLDAKRSSVLVYVQTVNARGELVALQPNYGAIIGPPNLGIDQQLRQQRSADRRQLAGAAQLPTLQRQWDERKRAERQAARVRH